MGKILEALAGTAFETLGSLGLGAIGRSWSNSDWSQQTSALNAIARQNALDTPSLNVQGLKKAGLNPALANAGAMTPLATSQAPKGSYPMQVGALDLVQAKLSDSESKNLEADTRLKNIEADRKLDEDLSANAQFRATLEGWLDSDDADKKASAQWLMAQDDVFSVGSLEGSKRAQEWREAYSRTTANAIGHEFARMVTEEKIKGNVPEVLANLDKWQLSKLGAELAEIQSRTLAIGLGMDVDKANIRKLVAETANIIEDTGLKHYSSFAKLVSSGEGLAAAAVFLQNAAMATAGMLPVAGMGTLGRLASRHAAPTTQKAFKGLTKFDSNSSVKPRF